MMTDLQNYITALDVFTRIKSFQNELFNSKKTFLKKKLFLSIYPSFVQ